MKKGTMRIAAAISALLLTTSTPAFLPFNGQSVMQSMTASAASANWKLDLGANAQNGFTGVSANDKYNKTKGYGFSGNDVKNVAAAGKNELSDAVQFTGKTNLNVDVPNGVYKVKVTLGNTSRTSVFIEDMLQIVNMTGNNAVHELLVPITDGQLNIRAGAGKSGTTFSISAIEISKYSDSTTLPPTIWLCGDSTVCNYYPLNSSTQAGWGQMLGDYVDKGWNIRNMAASGEYAQGFIKNGNFDPIEKYGKKGDVFIISIGINDGKYYKGDDYKKYVGDMTKRAKAKGMDVILVKQQGRKGDYSKKPLLTSRYFSNELDQIAKEQNCQVVDLFNLFQNYCVSIGAAKADAMYIDNVHPNREGAKHLAELFAKQFKQKPSGAAEPVVTDPPASTQPTVTEPAVTQPTVTDPAVTAPPASAATDITDGQIYNIKNVNSGLYLDVEGGNGANGANIQQAANDGKASQFKAVSAGNGYYYLVSQLGDGNSYALDVNGKKTTDGANIEIYTFNKGENQQFKFVKNNDGTYSILTKITADASALDVSAKSTESGANIQQYKFSGGDNQKFILEAVNAQAAEPSTTAPVVTYIPTPAETQPAPIQSQPAQQNVTLWGDANCDGKVDMSDSVIIMQTMANPSKYSMTEQGRANADVSESGNGITNSDALSIQKYCLSIITELPESYSAQQVSNSSAVTQPVSNSTTVTVTEPQPVFEDMYFASDMKITNGAPEDTNTGFKGKSYVNLDNDDTSAIEWTVNATSAGNYLCTFNIANGGADNRPMKIEVNGGKDYWMQDFLTTGDWTTWEERGIVLPLKQGTNSIKMTSASALGGPNLDYLKTELTDEPIAQIYEAPTAPVADNTNKNAARTIYIAGDSTVQTYNKSYAPQQGWGAFLGANLSDKITVSNQAIAGRSSKSFYDNGRLDTILGTIKKGDYLLVQFGINDAASNKAERYAPVSGKVPGTKGSFEDYMAKYIEGAKKKGATPILVTTVIGLKAYDNGSKTFKGSYTGYCNAMKQLAKYYDIPVIDLNTLMVKHYNSIGYDAAYKYHMCSTGGNDMTHFTETGAKAVAKLVADELKKQGLV